MKNSAYLIDRALTCVVIIFASNYNEFLSNIESKNDTRTYCVPLGRWRAIYSCAMYSGGIVRWCRYVFETQVLTSSESCDLK